MNLQEFKSRILPVKDKLFRFALSLTHNPAEAEDVVQEVLIKVWDRRREMSDIHNPEAWCMRLTRNLSVDKMRSKHQRTQQVDGYLELPDGNASPYQHTEAHDTMQLIRSLMERLSDKQRQVMHLRDIEGLTYEEISEALGLPVNQVKVNLHRARQAVRAQLLKIETHDHPEHS